MKFIKLTGYERGERILINPEHITHVRDNIPDGSQVYVVNGDSFVVREAFADPPMMIEAMACTNG